MSKESLIFVHPDRAAELKKVSARAMYKIENHKKRWEKRYGRPFPEPEMSFGSFGGINFIS